MEAIKSIIHVSDGFILHLGTSQSANSLVGQLLQKLLVPWRFLFEIG